MRDWPPGDSGEFAHVMDSRHARISVADLRVDVAVEDVGEDKAELELRLNGS